MFDELKKKKTLPGPASCLSVFLPIKGPDSRGEEQVVLVFWALTKVRCGQGALRIVWWLTAKKN